MLTSTKSGDKLEIPSFAATNLFLRLLSGTVTTEQAISLITTTLYPAAYLNELADDGRTRREVTEAVSVVVIPLSSPSHGEVIP